MPKTPECVGFIKTPKKFPFTPFSPLLTKVIFMTSLFYAYRCFGFYMWLVAQMVRAKDHKSLMVVRVRPTASFFPHSKVFRDEPTRCTTRRKIHGVEDGAMAPEFHLVVRCQ